MLLPNPSLHGLGIQPWRSTPPPGRSSPSPRRLSPSPRRSTSTPRRLSPLLGRLSPSLSKFSSLRSRVLDKSGGSVARLQRNAVFSSLVDKIPIRRRSPSDRLLMVNAHGSQAFSGFVGGASHKKNFLSFSRVAKNLSGSVSVVSAGAHVHRISRRIENLVFPFEVAWSRMAEMMKAGEWRVGSKQMVNLRMMGGETALSIGVLIAGRVLVWLLLTAPPWKDRLLQEDRLQRLATGLAWLPAKTKAARVRRTRRGTKRARFWGWARVFGPGPKPELQNCQFRAGPSMPVMSPDKGRCKSARFWERAWVLGPELNLKPTRVRCCKAARVWKWAWVLGPELNFKPTDVTV